MCVTILDDLCVYVSCDRKCVYYVDVVQWHECNDDDDTQLNIQELHTNVCTYVCGPEYEPWCARDPMRPKFR